MRFLNMVKNVSNWQAYLIYKYFGDKQKPFTFITPKAKIQVPARMMHTFKESFFDALYLKHLPKSLLQKKQITIIDVGANVGYFSLYAINQFEQARVISFEPMPMNYALLKEYANEMKGANWTIENKAVSEKPGTLTLHYDKGDSFTTSASIHAKSGEPDQATVPCVTLENIFHDHQLSQIDILKLDCEGSEYGILYHATEAVLNKVKNITIETHPGNQENENKTALIQFLKEKEYRVYSDNSDLLWASK